MTKKDKKKIEVFTKTKIKREYGWTDKCMQYLPEPNKIWYGMYSSQRYPAWTKDLVDKTNELPEVQEIIKNKNKHHKTRSAGAKKAVKTKTNNTIKKISKIHVEVDDSWSEEELINGAYQNHNDFLQSRNKYEEIFDNNFEVGEREIVNFIRHCLTSYEYDLDELYQQVGRDKGFDIISKKVFKAIKKAYPKYADGCDKQLKEHLSRGD